ncbi:MAG: hypothetical protein IKZ98_09900 [Clostridia bacterium]|nr:hypothetical protein [Clostridia bacterium]
MAARKDIRDRAKTLWIKGMKAIGNTAASIANNTRYKVDEVTIQNRRREVLGDLANKTYALWLKGEKFPEAMTKMLGELKQLDEQLNDIRAEKYAASLTGTVSAPAEQADEENGNETEEEEEDELPVSEENSSVCAEINGLFDDNASVGKMAEKVNSTLNQMSERINSFSPENKDDEQRQE